ncbi:MAG TPA: hypothetical protein VGR73_18215 [Bryobacteraceae bacterium]|nr:hypothetical protein [Bryobacteraceae bacterium]
MPFEQLIPRQFTSGGVHAYAPVASGVYGISNAQEWIYIGETDNIQDALLAHLRDVRASLMQRHPTGFVYEICELARRPGRQDRLVTEYNPACNRAASQHR